MLRGGGEGEGGVLGQFGHHLARLVDDPVQSLHLHVEGAVDALGLLHGQLVVVHQLVDIEPIAFGGGDAPRGGVGLFQIAHGGKLRHLVADGGGGDIQVRGLGDGLGTHRFGVLNEALHDGAEYFLFSLGQLQVIHLGFGGLSQPSLALRLLEC